MTDLLGIAAIIAAVTASVKSWQDGRRAARRDKAAAKERAEDRDEEKRARASAAEKLDRIASTTEDIGHKVDGARTELIKKVDSLRSDKAALSDALIARDEPGALSVNDSPGPVTIDKGKDEVHIAGEERRK